MISKKISPKKRKFVKFIMTSDIKKLNASAVCGEIGISTATYYRWLKDNRILKIAEEVSAISFEEYIPQVLEILVKKALQGDITAIKIFLDRYDNSKNKKNTAEKLTPDRIIKIIRGAGKKKKTHFLRKNTLKNAHKCLKYNK